MKKMIAVAMLCTFAVAARADELADGTKAWEKHDFAQAQQIYTRLAHAGNTQAQLLLGELYGFGEGVPEDLAQAEKWIAKAQAGGSGDAAAALATVRQRAARKADIARYVAGDAGAAPALEKFGCVKPVFPEVSRTQAEIRAVAASTTDWRACYERFGDSLAARQMSVKAIPEDVANLMSLVELDSARDAMDQAAVQGASAEAKAVMAGYDDWYARTERLGLLMEMKFRDVSYPRRAELDMTAERQRSWTIVPVHR